MKFSLTLMAMGVLVLVLLCSGCTSTPRQAPSPTSTTTPVISPATTVPTLVPAAAAYPEAQAVGQYATFGSGTHTGKATVYRYAIKPAYNWTEPTLNSAHDQVSATGSSGIQHGYITETPGDGNTFLFVYVRVIDTGTTEMYIPSPSQFVVIAGGTAYNYTSVRSSDVVIDNVYENQYDFRLGTTGIVGEIKPGDSNAVEGYLIYEVPQSISAQDTYVVANIDYQTRAVWRLA